MINIALYDTPTGSIVTTGSSQNENAAVSEAKFRGLGVILNAPVNTHPNTHYVLQGVVCAYTSEEIHLQDNLPQGFAWKMPERITFDPRTDEVRATDTAIAVLDSRSISYPPLTDLADALYWQSKGKPEKMDAYLAACEAVKLQYPK